MWLFFCVYCFQFFFALIYIFTKWFSQRSWKENSQPRRQNVFLHLLQLFAVESYTLRRRKRRRLVFFCARLPAFSFHFFFLAILFTDVLFLKVDSVQKANGWTSCCENRRKWWCSVSQRQWCERPAFLWRYVLLSSPFALILPSLNQRFNFSI